jgi:hypothetical protein
MFFTHAQFDWHFDQLIGLSTLNLEMATIHNVEGGNGLLMT